VAITAAETMRISAAIESVSPDIIMNRLETRAIQGPLESETMIGRHRNIMNQDQAMNTTNILKEISKYTSETMALETDQRELEWGSDARCAISMCRNIDTMNAS
jgi:hypothetical protein